MNSTTRIKRERSSDDLLPPAKRRKKSPIHEDVFAHILHFVPKAARGQVLQSSKFMPPSQIVSMQRGVAKWGDWTPVLELFGTEIETLKQFLMDTRLLWGKGKKRDNELIVEIVKRDIDRKILEMMLKVEKPKGSTFNPGANDNDALRIAMKINNVEAVCALIQHSDVDPTIDNNEPILWAVDRRHQNVVPLLLKSERVNPRIAFLLATSLGYVGIVRLFLQNDSFDPSFDNNLALRGAKNLLVCSHGSDERRPKVVQLLQSDKHVQASLNRSD